MSALSAPKSPTILRLIDMLWSGPKSTMDLQIGAGSTHAPSIAKSLRRRGLELPCRMVRVRNRDGDEVLAGEYSLTTADRKIIRAWRNAK